MKHTLKAIKKAYELRNDDKFIETLTILNIYYRSSMTQVELAEILGMTQQAVSLIVRGERRTSEYKIYINLASNMLIGLLMEPILKRKFVKLYGDSGKLHNSGKRSK